MRRIIFTLLLVAGLFGCAAVNGPANFDNVEYGLINRIYTLSEVYKLSCGDSAATKENFVKLNELSLELVNYSSDIPYNTDTLNMVIPLNKIVTDANITFSTRDTSIAFCKLKLDNIETAAGVIKKTVAQRRRI